MTAEVVLGADHWGLQMKAELSAWLQDQGYELLDVGAHVLDTGDDYPDFAEAVGKAVVSVPERRGVLICGSGVGASIAANKVPGVRASLCHDTYSAHQGVEHDDMNVICLGARVIGTELAKEVVSAFLKATFSGSERHQRRVDKVKRLEQRAFTQSTSKESCKKEAKPTTD